MGVSNETFRSHGSGNKMVFVNISISPGHVVRESLYVLRALKPLGLQSASLVSVGPNAEVAINRRLHESQAGSGVLYDFRS